MDDGVKILPFYSIFNEWYAVQTSRKFRIFYVDYPHKKTAQSRLKGLRRTYTSNTALCLPGKVRCAFNFMAERSLP